MRIICKEVGCGACGGSERKTPDRYAVPLHWLKHEELHRLGSRHEEEFFAEMGIDPYALSDALWANTGSLHRMSLVLTAHQLQGSANLLGRKPRATP